MVGGEVVAATAGMHKSQCSWEDVIYSFSIGKDGWLSPHQPVPHQASHGNHYVEKPYTIEPPSEALAWLGLQRGGAFCHHFPSEGLEIWI